MADTDVSTPNLPPADAADVKSEESDPAGKVDAVSATPSSDDPTVTVPAVAEEPITYPLKMVYCGNCGLPPEYCEYFPDFEKCRQWLETNLPNQLGDLTLGSTNEEDLKKGRQKRGGKGLVKTKKAEKKGPTRICLSRAPRGKKKSVTVITGLGSAGIDLKVAAKFFGTKFACGSSVTGDDEIVIQGDVKDDLFDILPEKWPEIDEDCIEDLGDQKR